jgi:opacity protein-like surface antigen
MRFLALFLITLSCAWGQALSWGVRGGVPITDAFDVARAGASTFRQVPKRYTAGPTLELRLPLGLGVSFDVLYKKLEYERTEAGVSQTVSATQWEFPLLFKYRFGAGGARPYLGAGPTFNRISGLSLRRPTEFINRSAGGIAFAAGFDLKAAILHVMPELRITRRGSQNFTDPLGALFKSRLNQAEFLIGITF